MARKQTPRIMTTDDAGEILTPVGTLDFDYGFKLLRKRDANGTLEDPGRFHVSIGFF